MAKKEENALLKFDAYFRESGTLRISIDVGDMESQGERYTCFADVKGGGKWKRIMLKASEFKGENCNMPLQGFALGRALTFACDDETAEFVITNILWL